MEESDQRRENVEEEMWLTVDALGYHSSRFCPLKLTIMGGRGEAVRVSGQMGVPSANLLFQSISGKISPTIP